MAVGQTIADLKIRLEAQGTGEVEYLRNELGKLQKNLKLTETQLDRQRVAVKNLGRATKDTTNGMRLQISALEKIRTNASSTGASYSRLTRDINKLNSALKNQIDIERGVGSSGGRTRLLPFAGMREGLVGRDLKTGKKFDDKRGKTTADTLAQLLAVDYFTKRTGGFGKDAPDGFRGVKQFTVDTHNDTIALLTEALNGQTEASKGITLQSQQYRDILNQLKTATNKYTQTIEAQDAWSDKDLAEKSYRERRGRRLQDQFEQHRQSMWNRGYGGESSERPESGGTMRVRSEGLLPTPELDEYKALPRTGQFLKWLFEAPQWKKMKGEMKGQGSRERAFSFMPQYGEKTKYPTPVPYGPFGTYEWSKDLAKYQTDLTYGMPLRGTQKKGYGKSKFLPSFIDAPAPEFPKTKTGYQNQIGKLARDEKNLLLNSSAQIDTRKELDKVTEEYNLELEKYEKRIKGVTKAQEKSIRLGGKVAGTRDPATGAMIAKGGQSKGGGALAIYDPSFAMKQAGAGPNAIQQTVESLDQYLLRVRKSTKAQNLNINSLTKQRAKLDEIRNGLDPTSVSFRNATKAINSTDKALSKLNSNKFKGKNLMRTGQSILGATYFGGAGGGIGAALGGLLGGPGGAVTGGLVGSQIAQPITQFIGGSATYASDIAKLHIALETAAGSAENYKKALATAELVTQRFNVPQEIAARGMTRLTAAVVGAGGTVEHAAIAFHNITAAIKGTAGTSEDVKSAVTAMVQIFSKGRVSAEELSGQLGERFPGAVTKFQEANKDIYKSTADLQDALKKGEVGLNELWEFVMLLGVDFTKVAADIAASPEEAGMRAIIKMNALRVELGKKLKPLGAEFQVIQADLLEELIPVIENLADAGVKAGEAILAIIKFIKRDLLDLLGALAVIAGTTGIGLLIAQIVKLNASWFAMGRAIIGVKKAMAALNIVSMVNPWIALASGIATAIYWYKRWEARQKGLPGKAAAGDEEAIKELQKKLNKEIAKWKAEMNLYEKTIRQPSHDPKNKDKFWYKGLYDNFKADHDLKIGTLEQNIEKWSKAIADGNKAISDKLIEEFKVGIKEFKFPDMKKALQGEGETDLGKYIDSLGNKGEHLQNVFINAFKGMEDALTNFVMTGKIKFKEFARSIIADIARMIIKMMMFNALKGIGGWMDGNPLAALFGGGGKTASATTGTTAATTRTGFTQRMVSGSLPVGVNALGNVYGKNGIVPFYKGGVVNRPTLFPFANGVGLMSEVGPEAIMPLKRGKGGRLGVEVAGGGGGTTNVVVNVDAKGTSVEGQDTQAKMLGKMLSTAVQAEIARQKRPGGILS